MDYKSMLKLVKTQNPEMAHKEAMKLASEKYKAFKESSESFKGTDSSLPDVKLKGASDEAKSDSSGPEVTVSALVAAEKRLRAGIIDINSLRSIGRQVLPDGEIVKHGKHGVNTMVTFEDKEGNKLPLAGYFYIYI